jgi:ketosteroid isomerase-like protein
MSDENELREMLASYQGAMQRRDPSGVVAHLASGIVAFTLAPPLRQDSAEVIDPARIKAWFAGFESDFTWEMTALEITVGGDVAFAHSVNHLSATPAGTPHHFDLWFRATYGLRKVDGAWLIAHDHSSTPFYMDGTMRAAVDLTP